MKKIRLTAALLAVAALMGGCEKTDDSMPGMIEIFAEPLSGGTKVVLDGANSQWEEHDAICINGDTVEIVSREGGYYVNYTPNSSDNRAFYPATLNAANTTQDHFYVTFPATYHYRCNGNGSQLLELPMAAKSTGNEAMQFKHLTGALYVTVTNTASIPLTLQSVKVTSNKYQLSGSKTVDIASFDIAPANGGTDKDRSVSLLFDTGYTLAANASLRVMLPVLPVGSSHKFSVEVRSYNGTTDKFYCTTKSQTSSSADHSLSRNQLGYVPMDAAADNANTPIEIENNKISIRTPYEFYLFCKAHHSGSYSGKTPTVSIENDLDMTGLAINALPLFAGEIEGNGHVVDNLTVNSMKIQSDHYACALFQTYTKNIRNITFDHMKLSHHVSTTRNVYFGGIMGYCNTEPQIKMSSVKVNVASIEADGAQGLVYFGGLIGNTMGKVTITDCEATCNIGVEAGTTLYLGGLIGYANGTTLEITGSSWGGVASWKASRYVYAGGLIGRRQYTYSATNCQVSGAIHVESTATSAVEWYVAPITGEKSTVPSERLDGTTYDGFSATMNGVPVATEHYGKNLMNYSETYGNQ